MESLGGSHKIAVIGAGGLGHPAVLGLLQGWNSERDKLEVTVFDGDTIELSNLNRQVLFFESDVGKQKANALVERAQHWEPFGGRNTITLNARNEMITAGNIEAELYAFDCILDACDSIPTKFLLNDYCAQNRKRYCYGGAVGVHGLWMLVDHTMAEQHAPCLRCYFGDDADVELQAQTLSCQQAGIIGAVAGFVGFNQAEAYIAAMKNRHQRRGETTLYRFNGVQNRITEHVVKHSARCRFSNESTARMRP